LTMITASFLPTAVLGVSFRHSYCDFREVGSYVDAQTFFSGTKIWDQPHGHAKYWGIIFGGACTVGLCIYLVGILYSWWTFEDLAEGLSPIIQCLSRPKEKIKRSQDKRRARKEKVAKDREAHDRETRERGATEHQNVADVEIRTGEPRARRFVFLRRHVGKERRPRDITDDELDLRALDAAERGSMTVHEEWLAMVGKME
jgi:hypothetical protein